MMTPPLVIPSSLECREFVHSEGKCGEMSTISVMQYNILADAAIPKGDSGVNITGTYSYCPESHRYMDSRHERIIEEVRCLAADVVTMQEIECDYYHNHLKSAMWDLGYEGVHHLRKTDHIGLTIFYKRDKLCLVSEDTFIIHERVKEFMNRVGINSKAAKVLQEHMRESATYPSILDPPGCVFSKLRLIEDNHTTLCIATTHITWKGLRYPILQMLQGACVIEEMIKFADGAACILAGDFNTQPDMPLYQIISKGLVCDNTMNLLRSGDNYIDSNIMVDEQHVLDILEGIRLRAQLNSAYIDVMGKEPDTTNIDESMVGDSQVEMYSGCLDYIWYSQEKVKPITVLDIPHKDILHKHEGLPSVIFPSDHLPIYAEFELLGTELENS